MESDDGDELLNSQQVTSSTQEREVEREADHLKKLIKFNKNCWRELHLEGLRNRRLFKRPQFTKWTHVQLKGLGLGRNRCTNAIY